MFELFAICLQLFAILCIEEVCWCYFMLTGLFLNSAQRTYKNSRYHTVAALHRIYIVNLVGLYFSFLS